MTIQRSGEKRKWQAALIVIVGFYLPATVFICARQALQRYGEEGAAGLEGFLIFLWLQFPYLWKIR